MYDWIDYGQICSHCGNPCRFTTGGPGEILEDAHPCPHGEDCGSCETCDWVRALVDAGPPSDLEER